MSDKRYQECHILEKLYRRLKYQPCYFVQGCWCYLKQTIRIYITKEKLNKLESPSLYFSLIYGTWQSKAKWYWTMEEMQEKFKRWKEEL